MSDAMTTDELAALFTETGRHHHQAYIDADGADAEWALWYASFLQTRIWDRLGRLLTRSEIVYLLVGADRAVTAAAISDWQSAYATHFVEYIAEA